MMTEIVSYQLAFNLAQVSLQRIIQERPKTFLSGLPVERQLEYKLKLYEELFFVEQTIQYNPEFKSLLFVAKFKKDSQDHSSELSDSNESFFDVYIELDVRFKSAEIFLINIENGDKTIITYKPEDLDVLFDVIKQKEREALPITIHKNQKESIETNAQKESSLLVEETELEYIETPETKQFLYQLLMDNFLEKKRLCFS